MDELLRKIQFCYHEIADEIGGWNIINNSSSDSNANEVATK